MTPPGPVALVGSGEYLPVMDDVERGLLAGRPSVWVQLATAAAPEGQGSLARWHGQGAQAADRLGVTQVVVPVVDRVSADDEAIAGLVQGAGLVYLSGGNPTFLAETLAGTRTWAAIHAAWQAGAALAGCSAGAMALAGQVARIRGPIGHPVTGLGVVPGVVVLPHFDKMAGRVPDVVLRGLLSTHGLMVLGIDEDTAVVGDPGTGEPWRVQGRQSAWVLTPDGRVEHPAGSEITLP
jgi:cyanophycinase